MGLSTHSVSFCLWGKAGDLLTQDSSILSDTAKVVLGGGGFFLRILKAVGHFWCCVTI